MCSCFIINGFEFAIFYFAKCRVISHERNPEKLNYIVLYYLPEAKLNYVTNITCIFFEHWNFLGLDVRESLVFVVNSAEAGRKNSTIRTKRPYHRFSVKSRHAQENLKKYGSIAEKTMLCWPASFLGNVRSYLDHHQQSHYPERKNCCFLQ